MKKRQILFLLTAIVFFVVGILTPLTKRITYEKGHTGYVTAIALDVLATQFDEKELADVLKAYKQSGVQTAAVQVNRGNTDIPLLAQATDAQLEIALILYADCEYTDASVNALRQLLKAYPAQYILIKNAEGNHNIASLAALFEGDDAPILVLCENKSQLSNESPEGIEACIAQANGRILRAYETNEAPGGDADTIYYQMMNSARDRNTEFLLINQRTDAADTPAGNAEATQSAAKKFCTWMENAGYTPGFADSLAGYNADTRTINGSAAAIGILMLIFILHILFGKLQLPITDWVLYLLAFLMLGVTRIMPQFLLQLYPTVFTLLGACFAMTFTMYIADKTKDKLPYFVYIPVVLLAAAAALLACCAVLAAMLSGADYYLNIHIYRGVGITLIAPMLYMALLMLMRSTRKIPKLTDIKNCLTSLRLKIRFWYILLIVALLGIVALYLIRSGNTNISALEKSIRNFMAEGTLARPRTKEFLLGWPALALLAFSIKHDRSKLFASAFAIAASILFASVMNTFCHVFTDVTTSLLRTANGFIFAIPFMSLCLMVAFIATRPKNKKQFIKK